MSTRSKRPSFNSSVDPEIEEIIPLSPITSPDPKPLTKRQEQNRAAQRAFRERRAQTLKEMESRLIALNNDIKTISKEISRINGIENELQKVKDAVNHLFVTVDSMTVPTWTVPGSEDMKSIIVNDDDEPARPIGAVLGALRPSSTDPTLTSPNQ